MTGHAHGFVPQTLADLGIVGLAVTTLLLLAWLIAAARATALYPRRLPFRRGDDQPLPRRDWTGERIALVALALMAVVFGLQSAIDWTWFVPGPAAMALVAAGFVAGRGPAGAAADTALDRTRAPLTEPAPPRLLLAAGVLLTALLAAWAIWQPEAGDRATGRAVDAVRPGPARRRHGRDRGRSRRQPAQRRAAARERRQSRPGRGASRTPRRRSRRRC